MKQRWILIPICALVFFSLSCSGEAPSANAPASTEILGQQVALDCEQLTLSAVVSEPADLGTEMEQLTQLKSLEVTRVLPDGGFAAWLAAWDAFEAEHSAISLVFRDRYHDADTKETESLTVTALPENAGEEFDAMARLFTNLSVLDLTALSVSSETVVEATVLFDVLWNDPLFGPSDSSAQALTFSDTADAGALAGYLSCFPELSEADIRAAALSEDAANTLCAAFPDTAFRRTVALNGTEYDSYTEELVLDGAVIADYAAFSDGIGAFPHLTSLSLHDCSLSNEELAALRERYPNAGVVWTVHFGKWSCRTDAVAFSTMQSGDTKKRQTAERVSVLQYCQDLIALDLGHNAISDIEWITKLQNLQVLILADNKKLRDIRPLAELKNLKYVELFMNPITDISPLAELPELLDVNLCITRVEDLTPLVSCTKLERIWIGHQTQQHCSEESLQTVLEAFPNAQYDLLSVSCTNRGWREHPRFEAFRAMFTENVPVAPFLPA